MSLSPDTRQRKGCSPRFMCGPSGIGGYGSSSILSLVSGRHDPRLPWGHWGLNSDQMGRNVIDAGERIDPGNRGSGTWDDLGITGRVSRSTSI